ncbi:MAG: rhomboid family intramembrane serine protease [Mangrovibacterium sp.]
MAILQELKDSFKQGSVVTRLIYLNVGVFVLLRLLEAVVFLAGGSFSLVPFLALPASADALLHRPWTIMSYMFLHHGVLHLLFNVLWLYWMGELFLRYFTQNQLLGIYLLGGVSGGLLYILLFNISPSLGAKLHMVQLLGASGSVLAIMAAVATYAPNHPIRLMFIGELKMKHFALASLVLYTIGMAGSNAGGDIAHVGGMIFGFFFIVSYRKGTDLTRWVPSLIYYVEKLFTPKSRIKVSYRNPNQNQQKQTTQQQAQVDQERINAVLAKVRQSGYDSLSKEEKELLFKMK